MRGVTHSPQGPPDGVCIPGMGAHSAWVNSLHLGPGQGDTQGCGCRDAGRNVSRRGKVELMHFAGRTSENRAFSGETIATRLRGCEVREGPGPREGANVPSWPLFPQAESCMAAPLREWANEKLHHHSAPLISRY